MDSKKIARVFDVRISVLSQRSIVVPGGTKLCDYYNNVGLIVVCEDLGRAVELVKRNYPECRIWQVNHHGAECNIIVDDAFKS